MNVVEYEQTLMASKPPALINTLTLKADGLTPWVKGSNGETIILV